MSDDVVGCRKCGSELLYIQEPEESPHAFRAVCSKCKNKKGEKLFEAWVSWEQIELIAELNRDAKIYPHRPFTENEIKLVQLKTLLRHMAEQRNNKA